MKAGSVKKYLYSMVNFCTFLLTENVELHDVHSNKLRQLLLTSHFNRYGRSKAIQDLLKIYSEHKSSHKKCAKKLTHKFAIQFRVYLITVLVIGNGLRASNVIELRVRDFSENKVVPGYEGHKVLTNDVYKTSTIYGEKFIVSADTLYDHYCFYMIYLRNKISDSKSNKVFLAASGLRNKMTQTNVSASLTAD